MPNTVMQGSARTPTGVPGAQALHPQGHSPSPRRGWLAAVRVLMARSRQRRALGQLAERSDARLKDIGVLRNAALREAAKPFWRR